jgi:isocitrate dehydrogenase
MMLVHIGQTDVAERVHNAWLRTLEDGIHTYDVYKEGVSREKVGTKEFAAAVVARVGQLPLTLKPVKYQAAASSADSGTRTAAAAAVKKDLVGVDVFLDWSKGPAVKVWPGGHKETFCSDHWRCRFLSGNSSMAHDQIVALLNRVAGAGFDFIKTENLYNFDGERGFSLDQGA